MQKYTKISIITALCICSLNAENSINNENLQDENLQISQNIQNYSDENADKKQQKNSNVHDLGTINVKAKAPLQKYQSGKSVQISDLQNRPSGNGDIGSALKGVSNVQFNTAHQSSNNPGEIDPASISISGGVTYQNNFQLDGININNDLFSNGEPSISSHNTTRWGTTPSQGQAIDTSLLESIDVLDSNIPASYGGFMGGVVDAKTRRPRSDGWHGKISYQHTSDNFTKQFIDEDNIDAYINNTQEHYQPKFQKNIYRATLEGHITDEFGLMSSFSTTRSKIPINLYSGYTGAFDSSPYKQSRRIDNYFLKTYWTPNDNFTLENTFSYSPQKNRYFRNWGGVTKDGIWDLESGGLTLGTKAILENDLGKLTSQLSYTDTQSTRDYGGRNIYKTWFVSTDKNWHYSDSSATPTVNEGGFGDMEQKQKTIEFKTDFDFKAFELIGASHEISAGIELGNQRINRKRQEYMQMQATHNANNKYIENLKGQPCGIDSFGLDSCSTGALLNPILGEMWEGQYFTKLYRDEAYDLTFNVRNIGLYLQDDININLGNYGEINLRPGLRFDKNNYQNDNPISPRFAMNYVAPWGKEDEMQTAFSFGANRYYARNQYSYKLTSTLFTNWDHEYTRSGPNEPWVELKNNDRKYYTEFEKLKTSYSDELTFGIRQDLGDFNAQIKYIDRKNKKEVVSTRNNPSNPNMYSSYWKFTNDGKSSSKIFTIDIQNSKPLHFANTNHTFSFAFDKTVTKRSFNPIFTFSEDNDEFIDDKLVMYDGKIIRYRDRPTENFATPWTARFTTTHEFNLFGIDTTLTNFFRLRDGYDAMVKTGTEGRCAGTNKTASNCPGEPLNEYDIFEKMSFKRLFTWDARIGFEKKLYKENALFVNVDIYNVLNKKNMVARTSTSGQALYNATSSASTPMYEIGRQFWVEVGYKF